MNTLQTAVTVYIKHQNRKKNDLSDYERDVGPRWAGLSILEICYALEFLNPPSLRLRQNNWLKKKFWPDWLKLTGRAL